MPGSTAVLGHPGPSASTGTPKPVALNSEGWQLGGSSVSGGGGGGGRGGPGGKRALAHIDDITSVTAELDLKNVSIGSLLQQAEQSFQQACTARSFGRLDLALKEYIRVNDILLGIPTNSAWPTFVSGNNKVQLQRYKALRRQHQDAEGDFMRIKEEIKADNARTGIQPTVQKSSSNGPIMKPTDASSSQNGTKTVSTMPNSAQNGGSPQRPPPSPSKAKPVVHPKPSNLHGKPLNSGGAGAASSEVGQALLQRFNKLRTSTASAGQDPRIRTQPIPLPAPNSQPGQAPPKASFESDGLHLPAPFAQMPRVPAAIYNPARGTLSSEAGELPSSSPRAIFTRTNSMTSPASPNRNTKAPVSGSSNLAQRHGVASGTTGQAVKPTKPTMPPGETISAEALLRYMSAGGNEVSILFIDIRSREDFDAGHIKSPATICIEPDILTREFIGADEILDSMVLAPKSEQLLFEKRTEFDLVVFYDQDSKWIDRSPTTPKQKAVLGMRDAITFFDLDFGKGGKEEPKLLEGGLEAWTRILGQGGLQTSSTAGPGSQLLPRRRPTYAAPPIQEADEAKKWKDMIDDAASTHIRTTEDFLRRFPPVSPIQESMVSPIISPISSRPSSPGTTRPSHDDSYYTSLPSPPARPPPAVPRRSHSGLAETDAGITSLTKRAALRSGVDHVRTRRVGLENPHNHCFANSVIQSLFATPGFGRELWSGEWKTSYPVPRSPDDKIDNPQLLTGGLANVFNYLNQGVMKSITAKTLMKYIHHIDSKDAKGRKKPENEIFGGETQQDANEFYYFLTDNIHDETNRFRNKKNIKSASTEYTSKDGTIIQHAISFWRNYSLYNSSIIDKYFRGVEVFISQCQNPQCGRALYNFAVRNEHVLRFGGIPQNVARHSDAVFELEQLLQYSEANESVDGVCEACKSVGLTRKYTIARMPDRLIFSIGRFTNEFDKVLTKVRFPIRDLDLTRYMAQPDPEMNTTDDIHFAGRMIYDCYAVTVHQGTELRSGHYYSYVQDDQSRDPTDWFRCNDTQVERVKIGSTRSDDMTERMYKDGTATAYQIFYKRRGT